MTQAGTPALASSPLSSGVRSEHQENKHTIPTSEHGLKISV